MYFSVKLHLLGLTEKVVQMANSINYFLIKLNLFFNYQNYKLIRAAVLLVPKQNIENLDDDRQFIFFVSE